MRQSKESRISIYWEQSHPITTPNEPSSSDAVEAAGTWSLQVQPDSASLPRSVPTVTHPSGKRTNSLSAQAVMGASNAGIAGISWRRLQPTLELPTV